ncbi:MAG: hypothetical protein GWO20_11720 [Candidatus Korarchaeota archaeon]|nr:hypothetical protein [Candidatus Korarchaeota archaeon]NIU84102.1 hypothetical protein [Candidatus Thorarchaeota archaeon]NIW14246.1 hypothetical protein [Candidatus Thorarchaeota archaeon]NIW52338.1 hypothetical protein [Candidatus Korarchaeota archaeon]
MPEKKKKSLSERIFSDPREAISPEILKIMSLFTGVIGLLHIITTIYALWRFLSFYAEHGIVFPWVSILSYLSSIGVGVALLLVALFMWIEALRLSMD